MSQSGLEAKMSRTASSAAKRAWASGFGFAGDWLRKWLEFSFFVSNDHYNKPNYFLHSIEKLSKPFGIVFDTASSFFFVFLNVICYQLLMKLMLCCEGTDEPVVDDMQRLEQQAQAVAASKDVSTKLKEKVLFVR